MAEITPPGVNKIIPLSKEKGVTEPTTIVQHTALVREADRTGLRSKQKAAKQQKVCEANLSAKLTVVRSTRGVIHPLYCKYHLLKVQEGSDPRAHSAKEPAAKELRSRTPRSRTAALIVYNAAANASKMSAEHGRDWFHKFSLAMVFRIVFRGGRRPPRINSASSANECKGTRPNTSQSGLVLFLVSVSSIRRLSRS